MLHDCAVAYSGPSVGGLQPKEKQGQSKYVPGHVSVPEHSLRTRQRSQVASELLIDGLRKPTGLAFVVGEELAENRTVFESTTVIRTLVNGLLKDINIPSVNKIGVEAVSCSIALGKDERLLTVAPPTVGKEVGLIDDLVEDGDQLNRMRVRAPAVVILSNWVSAKAPVSASSARMTKLVSHTPCATCGLRCPSLRRSSKTGNKVVHGDRSGSCNLAYCRSQGAM